MSDKIVMKDGKWILLPGATREDEMKLIELEIAQRKAVVDAKKASRGEPALKDDDDVFDDDDEFDDVEIEEKPKPKPKPAKESRAMLVFNNALRKGRELITNMGDYSGYFHRYGIPIDPDKVQSVKQLIRLVEKEGAICVEYRKGFGLRMIVGTRRYVKSCENESYWSTRGIDIDGIKTTKQLIRLMINCSASKMEVRDGFAKLLPDFWYNTKTGKKERSGVWIDGKGRNQIAYTSTTIK